MKSQDEVINNILSYIRDLEYKIMALQLEKRPDSEYIMGLKDASNSIKSFILSNYRGKQYKKL